MKEFLAGAGALVVTGAGAWAFVYGCLSQRNGLALGGIIVAFFGMLGALGLLDE